MLDAVRSAVSTSRVADQVHEFLALFPFSLSQGDALMDDSQGGLDRMIQRAREDPEALGRLLEKYRSYLKILLKQHLSRKLAARCDASDIVQQTMMNAVRAFGQFRGSSEPEFSAWIKKLHANNLRDVLRKHVVSGKRAIQHEVRFDDGEDTATFYWNEPSDPGSTPSKKAIHGENTLRLSELMESLPESQREAVRMRHLQGRPLAEIAKELDRSVAATAGLIKRGVAALRARMSEDSWT
jgi:RNA polymerase sigma-70 factor (ECF subfamily)